MNDSEPVLDVPAKPAIPEHSKAGLAAMNWDKPLVSIADRAALAEQILARYELGESMADIAAELGLKAADQLYRLMLTHAPGQWRAYQSARAMRRMEQAQTDLETAQDGLRLSRAREIARVSGWELERLQRRLYGQEQAQINVQGDGITVQVVSFNPGDQGTTR